MYTLKHISSNCMHYAIDWSTRDLSHGSAAVMCQTMQTGKVLLECRQIIGKHHPHCGNCLLVTHVTRTRQRGAVALPHLGARRQQPITDQQLHRLCPHVIQLSKLVYQYASTLLHITAWNYYSLRDRYLFLKGDFLLIRSELLCNVWLLKYLTHAGYFSVLILCTSCAVSIINE